MLVAVLAGIIAAVIAVCIVAVIVVLRQRYVETHATTVSDMSTLDTVGVGAEDDEDIRVKSGEAATAKPSDGLSKRFGVLGVLAAAIFATLGAKLWSMQIMNSGEYSSEAEKNLYTTVRTPAPRGSIFDRNGRVLVTNRASQTVLAESEVSDSYDTIRRLSSVLGLPVGIVRQRLADTSHGAQSQRIIASDVRLRDVAFISEHADAFPGVSVETRTVRAYPNAALAAHVLGYTGSPTEDELSVTVEGREIDSNDILGKSGIEAFYDNVLSGEKGQRNVMVDASGNVVSVTSETAPTQGSDIYLTINSAIQYAADQALAKMIAPTGEIGTGSGVAGAVVALDARDGGVLAMASYPTFDPSNFTNGIPQDIWDLYNTEESHAPMLNRTINGQYAAASTFKAFTSMAGMEYGYATESSYWTCTGKWDGFNTGAPQWCWEHKGHGTLDLSGGIIHSCDTVFYEIAKAFYDHGPDGTGEISATALQEYVEKYNFGKATGIDLKNESVGRVPTPEWKAEHWRNVPSEATWRGGDYTNMIIGQGDILVTPLQVAAGYCGISTGKIMKPHLLKEVRNAAGDVAMTFEPEVLAEPDVNLDDLNYVRNALRGMIIYNDKVRDMFDEEGLQAAGKSGTAEHTDRADDAWFVAYAPYDNPKYVVACILEQGRSGSKTAAKVVAQVLGAAMRADAGEDGEVGRVAGSSGKSLVLNFSADEGREE
ncbi:penicillin-binding protein 2 [Adlercreutzia sp. ZJ304]|uniref:penicillin-binding protein 2 n=1 Tax=Adlercreutzia sp. ZJ304 TaxID=2709791 RepID=UPI0013EB5BD1|nr:penicillin-binding protein 2 [Adlercreutzia sp. ZJ304]